MIIVTLSYDSQLFFYVPYLGIAPMTKTKTILVLSLVAVFAISIGAAVPLADASAHPGHLDIKKTDVKAKNDVSKGTHTLDVKIDTTSKIPTDGLSGLFGYGIISDPVTFNNTLALTSHGGAFDHSHQLPVGSSDPVFHAHVLDLAFAGTIGDPCSGVGDAVVDFASSTSGTVNNIDAQYKVKVHNNKIDVKKVPVSDLNDAGVEGIVAFNIIGVGEDPNAPDVSGHGQEPIPWLCLDIVGLGTGL